MAKFAVRDPYTGKTLAELAFADPKQISGALEKAQSAFSKWRTSSASERSQLLNSAAAILESRKDEFARTICEEAGKPVTYARIEVERALGVLRWAAAETQRFSGELLRLDTTSSGRQGFGIHQRFPRGVILGITPFNFPLNLVIHKVAPALACGCTMIVKPSPETPITAMKLAEIFHSLQPDLFQVVMADDESSAELTKAREIAMISFTGSAKVGWMIRKQAPEKPTALELGGNAWVIVLEDTPKEAYPAIIKRINGAAYGYSGQSCISVQNAAIAKPVWKDFQEALAKSTEAVRFGDPHSEPVICGPLIRQAAAERIRSELGKAPKGSQIVTSSALEKGASQDPNAPLLAPTLVTLPKAYDQLEPTSLVQEEIFGPILTASSFEALPKLIERINSGRYGLQAGIFTQNLSAIERLYRDLDVGGVIVNDVPTTRYDHQPYGGIKESGQGREGIKYAMEEMCESKFLALSGQILGY